MLTGGCHCGKVRFEVDASNELEVYDCNCSICRMTGYWHLIVPAARFRLIAGKDAITTYAFNKKIAQHYFCATCGIKSFYVPRSNPDGFCVNARCLDEGQIRSLKIMPFDGKNWEAAPDLSGLSGESAT